MSTLDDVLAALLKYPELGAWGTPADFSVLCRQDQPPASGNSQYKVEDVPMAANSYLGRVGGDIVARTFANVLADIGAAAASHNHTESDITDLDHDDTDAIHDNVSGEISAITAKGTPIDADFLLIEDSAASNVKKRITIGSLPGGGGGDTHPIADSTAIVKGSGDATKLVRVEADGITTGTTRVLTMADQNIDLTPGTGSFATEAEGNLAATALQNITAEAITSLSDVAAKTGSGTTVVMGTTPTIITPNLLAPTITSFVNAAHDHQDAAGGATLDAAAIAAGTFPTARIADDAITYAKIQDVSATDRLLGRVTAGAGVVEEITLTAAGRALIDDANAAAQRTTLGLGTIATAASTAYLLLAGQAGGQTAKGGTGSGDDLTLQSTNHSTRGDLKMVDNVEFAKTAVFDTEVDNGNSGTSDTINWTAGNKQKSTMTGNVTYTFTAPAGPCNLILRLIQDAGGTNTATWPASVKWAGGTKPVIAAGSNDVSIVAFYFDGTSYHGTALLDSS